MTLITGQRQNRSAQQLTLCKHRVSAHKSNRDGEKWYPFMFSCSQLDLGMNTLAAL